MASFRHALKTLGGLASVIGGGYLAVTKLISSSANSGGLDMAAAPVDAERLAPVASPLPSFAILGEEVKLDGLVLGGRPSAADTSLLWVYADYAMSVVCYLVLLCYFLLLASVVFVVVVDAVKAMYSRVSRAWVVRLVAIVALVCRAWVSAGEWLNMGTTVAAILPGNVPAVLIAWTPVLRFAGAVIAAICYFRRDGLWTVATFEELFQAYSFDRRSYLDATARCESMQRELTKTREATAKAEKSAADSAARSGLLLTLVREASEGLKMGRQNLSNLSALLGDRTAQLQHRSTILTQCLLTLVMTAGKLFRANNELRNNQRELSVAREERESLLHSLKVTRSALKDKTDQLALLQSRALRANSIGTQTDAPRPVRQTGAVRRPVRPYVFPFSSNPATFVFSANPATAPEVEENSGKRQRADGEVLGSKESKLVFDAAIARSWPALPEIAAFPASGAEVVPSGVVTPPVSISSDPVPVVTNSPQGESVSAAGEESSARASATVCYARPGVPCSSGANCIGNPLEYDERGACVRGPEGRYGATGAPGKKLKQQAHKLRLCSSCFVKLNTSQS